MSILLNTYKRLCSLLLVYILITGCYSSRALQRDSTSELEIRKVLNQQQEAWNRGDIPAFMNGYWHDAKLSFIGSKGITRGWDQTLANYQKTYPDKTTMGRLEFEVLELTLLSEKSAYMIGKYTLHRIADKPSGYFNLVWRQIDDQWLIISDHTSS